MTVPRGAAASILVLALAVAGCGSVALGTAPRGSATSGAVTAVQHSGQAVPGQPVPASAVRRLTTTAEQIAAANGGHPVVWATAVVTTHRKALTSATPGDLEPGPDYPVYLVTIKGYFVCGLCSTPSGGHQPTGSYLSLVLDARTFSATDFGLSDKAPPVAPASLGPVTHLKGA
jgi:hypothetical protein